MDRLAHGGDIAPPWLPAMKALMLVEMRERPTPVRFIEWIAGSVPVPRSRCITKGPFQMQAAPLIFEYAAVEAARRLTSALPEPSMDIHWLERLALLWNGSRKRQPGAALSYAEALALALQVIAVRPEERTPVANELLSPR